MDDMVDVNLTDLGDLGSLLKIRATLLKLETMGLTLHSSASVWRGRPLECDDAGRIVWASKGALGTLRPSVIATRMVEGTERVEYVLAMVIGPRAELSEQWKREVAAVVGFSEDQIGDRIVTLRAPAQPGVGQ